MDDASTDASYQVMAGFAKDDSRVRLLRLETNGSAWIARKRGIEAANGKYILFVDGDDTLEVDACEILLKEISADPVDILHFGTEIVDINGLPEERLKMNRALVAPFAKKLTGDNVLLMCFNDRKYGFQLWNKLFDAKVCKRALPYMEDMVLPKGQDKLLYFMLACEARSYRGLPDKCFYHYQFGRGGSGLITLTMPQFERYCTNALTAEALHSFLNRWYPKFERFTILETKFRQELLNDCFARWLNDVSTEDKSAAFDLMLRYWQKDEIVGKLVSTLWYKRDETAKSLLHAKSLKYDHRPVKTILAYYHSCANGGAQRVCCQLANLWVQMGLKVVLLTDEAPTDADYALDPSIKRYVLPHYQRAIKASYIERYRMLTQIICDENADAFVNHAWVAGTMMWDEITCKLNNVAFIAHCHNIFSCGFLIGWDVYTKYIAPYRLADATITLSKADRAFWEHFTGNVYEVNNPLPDGDYLPSATFLEDNHNVLWIGRLANEKNPFDALKIWRYVIEQVPDAVLHIVGGNSKNDIEERLKAYAQENGLNDNVVFHGFQTDVTPYYSQASLLLMTSSYEGYPLTLLESIMAGIPCVMYELPYLSLTENKQGIMTTKLYDVRAAAAHVIKLLKEPEVRRQLAREVAQHADSLRQYDYAGLWKRVFDSLKTSHDIPKSPSEQIMMDTLFQHYALYQEENAKQAATKAVAPPPPPQEMNSRIVRYALLIAKTKSSLRKNGLGATLSKISVKVKGHFSRPRASTQQ